jgi:hypothetical protein
MPDPSSRNRCEGGRSVCAAIGSARRHGPAVQRATKAWNVARSGLAGTRDAFSKVVNYARSPSGNYQAVAVILPQCFDDCDERDRL